MAVFTKSLRKHIFVHPGDQQKLQTAIKLSLLRDRKKYSDSLEGALLDVQKVQVIGELYRIVNGYLSMEVIADFKVFAPTVGMALEGVINKVNRSHYGCLVMDLFNVSLSLPNDSSLVPKEGDECTFEVTKLIVDGDFLFMRGQITGISGTAIERSANSNDNGEEMIDMKTDTAGTTIKVEKDVSTVDSNNDTLDKVTIKTEKEDDSMCENNHNSVDSSRYKLKTKVKEEKLDTSEENLIKESPKKHKKKRKSEEGCLNSVEDSRLEVSPKKHKKKRKSEEGCLNSVEDSLVEVSTKKHKKKRKSEEQCIDSVESESDHIQVSPKKHKKKHKSEKECMNSP